MSAREQVLGRLRAAAVTATGPAPDVAGWYARRRRAEAPAQAVARLRAALESSHAEVHDTDAAGWPERLRRIARAKGWRCLLVGAGSPHADALAAGGQDGLRLLRYDADIESWRDVLFDQVDAALTRARSAIADTGSLVLWPDRQEPRLMSLVPPAHVVLVDVATVHADLHQALVAERWHAGLPTNALLVSGPSKTADIQQTLAYGAHGPRELIVLLLHPPGDAA